jgi:hypothetical protein
VRRTVAPYEILTGCLTESKRSVSHGAQDLSAQLPRMEKIIAQDLAQPKRKRDPVKTYQTLSSLRSKR